MPPPGKANSAAMERRRGVSGFVTYPLRCLFRLGRFSDALSKARFADSVSATAGDATRHA